MNYLIVTYLFIKKYAYLINNYIESYKNIKTFNNKKVEYIYTSLLILKILVKIMKYIENIPYIHNKLCLIINYFNKQYELIEYKVDNNIIIYENSKLLDINDDQYKIARCIPRIYLSFNLNSNNNIINLKDFIIKYNATLNNKLINILKLNNIKYDEDDTVYIEYFKDMLLEKKEYMLKDILYDSISDIE